MSFLGKVFKPVGNTIDRTFGISSVSHGVGDLFSGVGSGIKSVGSGIGSGIDSIGNLLNSPLLLIAVGIGGVILLSQFARR